jgi:hypothetical protein
MNYILRAKNANLPQYNPESIVAWNVEPILEIAAAELWELVEDVEAALELSPLEPKEEEAIEPEVAEEEDV